MSDGQSKTISHTAIHAMDKRYSRAMVPVSPERPEEWVVAPDLPEQQDGVDTQMEQDAMVSSPEIST